MPRKRFADYSQRTAPSFIGLTLLTLVNAVSPAVGVPTTASQTPPAGFTPQSPAGYTTNSELVQGEESYTLGAGDRVKIDIFQVPQYSGESEVQIDGNLNLPLVGIVPVEGLTIEQTTNRLKERYGQFFRRTVITVSLISRRPLQVGIAGEVNRPGTYSLSAENAKYPTITQLLENAGGITQLADVRNVQIRRPQRSPSGQALPDQVINADLWQLLQTGDLRYDITLRSGDSVVIPETNVNLAEAPLLANTTFSGDATKPINIAVVGEVYRPGTYTVAGGTARADEAGEPGQTSGADTFPTVTRAIQVAGGIKPLANIRRVQVRRFTRAATEQTFEVDLWALLQEGDIRQDAVLQEGDTIVIPKVTEQDIATASQLGSASFSPDRIRINIVGEANNTGLVELAPNTSLNQALLAAGGFNNRARRGSVELVRLQEDGTVSRRRVPVDFDNDLNEESNPILRNNDVIIVNRSGLATVGDVIDTILTPVQGALSLFGIPGRFIRLFD